MVTWQKFSEESYFRGLSTDSKPYAMLDGSPIPPNAAFLEIDTFKVFFWDPSSGSWVTKQEG